MDILYLSINSISKCYTFREWPINTSCSILQCWRKINKIKWLLYWMKISKFRLLVRVLHVEWNLKTKTIIRWKNLIYCHYVHLCWNIQSLKLRYWKMMRILRKKITRRGACHTRCLTLILTRKGSFLVCYRQRSRWHNRIVSCWYRWMWDNANRFTGGDCRNQEVVNRV